MDINFKEVYIVFEVEIEWVENGYAGEYEDDYIVGLPTFITEDEEEAKEQAIKLIDNGAEASTFIKFRQYENGKLERVEGYDERYF